MATDARGALRVSGDRPAGPSPSSAPPADTVSPRAPASGRERGQILSMTAALVLFLFIVAAMTGSLPAGMQNALADVTARLYLDVPHAPAEIAATASSGTTTTIAAGPAAAPGSAVVTTTSTTIEEIGPLPTVVTTTAATAPTTSTTRAPSTTRPPATDAPPPTDPPPTAPPPTDVPSIVIPTTQPECVNPALVATNAQIQDNKRVVLVTVTFSGSIQHLQAAVAGQGFSSLTKVNSSTFIGSITSSTDVTRGTNVILLACGGAINQSVKAL